MYILYDVKREPSRYAGKCLVYSSIEALSGYSVAPLDVLFIGNLSGEAVTDPKFISSLGSIMEHMGKVIYARKSEESLPSIDMLVKSVDGEIYPTDTYLDTPDGMGYLDKSPSAKQVLTTDVKDSIAAVAASLRPSLNKAQGNLLDASLAEMVSSSEMYNQTLSTVAKNAVGIIEDASENIQHLRDDYNETKEVASKLTDALRTTKAQRTLSTKSLYTYPQISVDISLSKHYFYLKTAGPVQYLTSFAMGFSQYLAKSGRKPKIVIFSTSTPELVKVLGSIPATSVIQSSSTDKEIQYSAVSSKISVIVHPIRTIVNRVLGEDLYTDFIIIDEMNTRRAHLKDVSPVLWCADSSTWLRAYTSRKAFFGRAGSYSIKTNDAYRDMGLTERMSYYATQYRIYGVLEKKYVR